MPKYVRGIQVRENDNLISFIEPFEEENVNNSKATGLAIKEKLLADYAETKQENSKLKKKPGIGTFSTAMLVGAIIVGSAIFALSLFAPPTWPISALIGTTSVFTALGYGAAAGAIYAFGNAALATTVSILTTVGKYIYDVSSNLASRFGNWFSERILRTPPKVANTVDAVDNDIKLINRAIDKAEERVEAQIDNSNSAILQELERRGQLAAKQHTLRLAKDKAAQLETDASSLEETVSDKHETTFSSNRVLVMPQQQSYVNTSRQHALYQPDTARSAEKKSVVEQEDIITLEEPKSISSP